jgi:hypothetical protein
MDLFPNILGTGDTRESRMERTGLEIKPCMHDPRRKEGNASHGRPWGKVSVSTLYGRVVRTEESERWRAAMMQRLAVLCHGEYTALQTADHSPPSVLGHISGRIQPAGETSR